MQNQAQKEFSQFELSKLLITSKIFSKIKMSPSSRLVLIVLCSHYPNMYPSIKTIQEESGIASKTSVINSLKELSCLGIIIYETKNVNHYKFTQSFFTSLEIEPNRCKNWNTGGTKNGHKQINKKTINKENYKKNSLKYMSNVHITGINYKKYEKPNYGEKISPLEMNREQSIEFIKNLPKCLQNSYFAKEIRKKWNIKE